MISHLRFIRVYVSLSEKQINFYPHLIGFRSIVLIIWYEQINTIPVLTLISNWRLINAIKKLRKGK